MEQRHYLGSLKPGEWQRLQDITERYAKSWEQGAPFDMKTLLPSTPGMLRTIVLHELIRIDLEQRWRRGQPTYLDHYLEQFREIGTARALSPHLIFQEYHARRLYGDKPDLRIYEKRFPDQYPRLRELADLGQNPTTVVQPKTPPIAAQSTPSAPPLMAGVLQVQGGYRKIKRLGKGAFGEAWLAEGPGGVEAVVKIIFRPLQDAEAQHELEAMKLIRALHHPFLLQLHGFWSDQDQLVIAMELAEGSLRDRLRAYLDKGETGIPPGELIGYFQQAAEALDYLHSENVLHRDIKPDNILLLKGYAKVADFGLARILEAQSARVSSAGTPGYMAPEVWKGKAGKHSDQYALAATYVELRRGRRAFGGSGMMEAMFDHLERAPDLEGLPEAEAQVVARALAKDPNQRYGSCAEFVQALHEAVFPAQTVPPPVPPPPAPVRLLWLGVLAAGLICIALISFLVSSGTPTPREVTDPVDRAAQIEVATPVELTVKAGGTASTVLTLSRRGLTGILDLEFDAPPHVHISPAKVGLDQEAVEVSVKAAGTAATGQGQHITMQAVEAAGTRHAVGGSFALNILPPELPTGCTQVIGTGVERVNGSKYYKQLTFVLSEDLKIPFLLIPRQRERDPETFYIMEHKVWNDLFRRFAEANPDAVKNSTWQLGGKVVTPLGQSRDLGVDQGRLPVLRVTAWEANVCARWLGGLLPNVRQWDKASGRFEKRDVAGPFQKDWEVWSDEFFVMLRVFPPAGLHHSPLATESLVEQARKQLIAVNRRVEGPLPVGAALLDISPFGCRDMAGNGIELTDDTDDLDELRFVHNIKEPRARESVILRGAGYRSLVPLRFDQVGDLQTTELDKTDAEISFRVVIVP